VDGRQVFMGYLNIDDKTREVADGKRWLHSEDVGCKDPDGSYITGRIKVCTYPIGLLNY